MALLRLSGPTVEPVSAADAKLHCRIDGTAEDTYIATLISAARAMAEAETWRSLGVSTWELSLDAMPCGSHVSLPMAPVASVQSVKWVDDAGVEQTLAATEYIVDTRSAPGRVVLVPYHLWPATSWPVLPLRISYTAGYATAAAVPEPIRQAILLTVGHLYEHREQVAGGTGPLAEIPMGAHALLSPYRSGGWVV